MGKLIKINQKRLRLKGAQQRWYHGLWFDVEWFGISFGGAGWGVWLGIDCRLYRW